ncbi:MAG TPA: hypothetical protein VFP72_03710 [Kineosporiaceae bacterium]|nr:hypothetical protein [Kineosporiaceae bacterium]
MLLHLVAGGGVLTARELMVNAAPVIVVPTIAVLPVRGVLRFA